MPKPTEPDWAALTGGHRTPCYHCGRLRLHRIDPRDLEELVADGHTLLAISAKIGVSQPALSQMLIRWRSVQADPSVETCPVCTRRMTPHTEKMMRRAARSGA